MPKLGVNIDHIATLRQARGETDPDPVAAARICEKAGADSIVVHLREDRRHIQERDVRKLRATVTRRLNLEMSLNPQIVKIAAAIRPDEATLVPEKRAELTTEGGLDVVRHFSRIKRTVALLHKKDIRVSLFIDPVKAQIKKANETGARIIELHAGRYDHAR
ncbi:MAG: pyridoxine 5'-phosphate synthase, partial [Omnitrophica WOR_2 bacterium RIFCSPHIGHO2_02_FULL_52_10]